MEKFPLEQDTSPEKQEEDFHSYQKYFSLSDEELRKPLLDVGSGRGNFVRYLRNIIGNPNAFGVDYQTHKTDESAGIIEGDGQDLPFKDEIFEVVVAKNYLPMFVDESDRMVQAILELIRVTKHGGKIVGDIATPENSRTELKQGESTETLAWLKERHEGSIKLKTFLEELKGYGHTVNITNEKKGILTIIKG